jgi:hypothetical protein
MIGIYHQILLWLFNRLKRWAGNVARMGDKINVYMVTGNESLEDLELDGSKTLKRIVSNRMGSQ